MLDWNLFFRLPFQRDTFNKETNINAIAESASLPTFHHFFNENNETINFTNAQFTKEPSDIVYIMRKDQFNLLGTALKRLNLPFGLRLSRKPLKSFTYGYLQQYYWGLIGDDSLLTEPLSVAILKLKVCFIFISFF